MVKIFQFLSFLALLTTGCTHVQLRNDALNQAGAVHQLQQRQVLDNLAMFVNDPNAIPYFTVVGAATSAVSDTGNASSSLSWLRTGFQSVGLMLGAQRLNQENFTLAPVSDPDKLARMRCAYQAAVGGGGSACIDCCALEKQWGTKKWDGRPGPADPSWQCLDECMPTPGWFGVGCKKEVPKDACYVGHSGSTYIWVLPDGSDEFARLTLMMLDYATGVPPKAKTKTVKTTTKRSGDINAPITETIVEETAEVPVQVARSIGAEAEEIGIPQIESSPQRQNFFLPQAVPQVVIPAL